MKRNIKPVVPIVILLQLIMAQPGEQLLSAVERYTGLTQYKSVNPATMVAEYTFPSVAYTSTNRVMNGAFSRAFDPGYQCDNYLTASGRKDIGAGHIFRGSFSYHHQDIDEKMWVHTRQPYTGFPFLLADSSTGGFLLHGIQWQLDYGFPLIADYLNGGISIYYNVDENHKTVFPKPISNTRDMLLSAGLAGYFSGFIVDLELSRFGFQEINNTSKYSANQDLTPIFYKIRGFDNPLVFKGETSEERLTELAGWAVDFSLNRNTKPINGLLAGGYEQADAHLVDGGSYPVEQGWWYNRRWYFSGRCGIQVNKKLNTELSLTAESEAQTADHPDLKVKVYTARNEFIWGRWGVNYGQPGGNNLGIALNSSSEFLKQTDLFNGLLRYFPAYSLGLELLNSTKIVNKLDLDFTVGSTWRVVDESEIYADITDLFYDQVTSIDNDYYDSDSRSIYGRAAISWFSEDLTKFTVVGSYHNTVIRNSGGNGSFGEKDNRSLLNFEIIIERLNK